MRLEEEIFARKKPVFEKLTAFGFTRSGTDYTITKPFLGGDFTAEITVQKGGTVTGRVIETALGDEYLPLHAENVTGGFVSTVREAYCEVLRELADACFLSLPFRFAQTNRLTARIAALYGHTPDFPFAKYDTCGTFRHQESRKWYALVMDITLNKLTGKKQDAETVVEIMNLKAPAEEIPALIKQPGIYPAYHMNKGSWITLVLNDTLPDSRAEELIAQSYSLTAGSPAKSAEHTWVIPANPKYYDVSQALKKSDILLWKQGKGIRPGDTVYLYMAAPVRGICWRFEVLQTAIPYQYHGDDLHMEQAMRLRRVADYDPAIWNAALLKQYGLTAVRSARTVPESLAKDLLKQAPLN